MSYQVFIPNRSGADTKPLREVGLEGLLRDGDSGPAATTARALLARPIVRVPDAPPLGDLQLRPLEDPLAFLGHGVLEGLVYVNKDLGVRLPTAGFHVYAAAPSEEVTLEEGFGVSTLELTVSALMTAANPALEQRLAKDIVGGFEGVNRPVEYLGDTPLVTDAGPGHALRWFGREGTNEILVFVPVCGGRITLVAHGRGEGPGLWKEAKRALRGLRFDPGGRACRVVVEDAPPPAAPAASPGASAPPPLPAAASPARP